MRFSRDHLQAAIGEHINPAVAAMVRHPFDAVEAEDLGKVVAAALIPTCAEEMESCALHCVVLGLVGGPRGVILKPAEAMAHPMLAPWIGETLADAIAAPMIAGATLSGLMPGAPTFETIEVTYRGGASVKGRAVLEFASPAGRLTAVICYGDDTPDPAHVVCHRIHGGSLFQVGRLAYGLGEMAGTSTPSGQIAPEVLATMH